MSVFWGKWSLDLTCFKSSLLEIVAKQWISIYSCALAVPSRRLLFKHLPALCRTAGAQAADTVLCREVIPGPDPRAPLLLGEVTLEQQCHHSRNCLKFPPGRTWCLRHTLGGRRSESARTRCGDRSHFKRGKLWEQHPTSKAFSERKSVSCPILWLNEAQALSSKKALLQT